MGSVPGGEDPLEEEKAKQDEKPEQSVESDTAELLQQYVNIYKHNKN